eukprot:TRINITY_DN57686_c0_g1_i1.p1 TRINITY_DN57686_c0_g1~~TRINITY_DN57686_c0_g1_i1.p1  ORF type:complete len:1065 (+),score=110.64 TRINITY_DN57686_c0_g1_i1:94-3288(+)
MTKMEELAAVAVQKLWRGYFVRKHHSERIEISRQQWREMAQNDDDEMHEAEICELECHETLQRNATYKQWAHGLSPIEETHAFLQRLNSQILVQTFARSKLSAVAVTHIRAAIKIQAVWRGYDTRRDYASLVRESARLAAERFAAEVNLLTQEEAFQRANLTNQQLQLHQREVCSVLCLAVEQCEKEARQQISNWAEQYWVEVTQQEQQQRQQLRTDAATTIQNAWQAYCYRKTTLVSLKCQARQQIACANYAFEDIRMRRTSLLEWERQLLNEEQQDEREKIQKQQMTTWWNIILNQQLNNHKIKTQHAATTIQRLYRGYRDRRLLSNILWVISTEYSWREEVHNTERIERLAMSSVIIEATEERNRQYIEHQAIQQHHNIKYEAEKRKAEIKLSEISSSFSWLVSEECSQRGDLYLIEGMCWHELVRRFEHQTQLIRNTNIFLTAILLLVHQATQNKREQEQVASQQRFIVHERSSRNGLYYQEADQRVQLRKRATWDKTNITNTYDILKIITQEQEQRQELYSLYYSCSARLGEEFVSCTEWRVDRDTQARKMQSCVRSYLARKQLHERKAEEKEKMMQITQRNNAATKIKAAWKGKTQRRIWKRTKQNAQEQKLFFDLQEISRRQLRRDEQISFQSWQTEFNSFFASSKRRQQQYNNAIKQKHAATNIQTWFKNTNKTTAKKRAFKESLIEKQERAGRSLLVSEEKWQISQLLSEFVTLKDTIWRETSSESAAVRIQTNWRAYHVRKIFPKFKLLKEDINVYLQSEAIERKGIQRECVQLWQLVLEEECSSRCNIVQQQSKSEQQKQQEAEQEEEEQRKKQLAEEEAKLQEQRAVSLEKERQKKLIEFKDELNVIETMEALDRKSILRQHNYTLQNIREALDVCIRNNLPAPKPLLASSSARRSGEGLMMMMGGGVGSRHGRTPGGAGGSAGGLSSGSSLKFFNSSFGGASSSNNNNRSSRTPSSSSSVGDGSSLLMKGKFGQSAAASVRSAAPAYLSDSEVSTPSAPPPFLRQQSKTPPPLLTPLLGAKALTPGSRKNAESITAAAAIPLKPVPPLSGV